MAASSGDFKSPFYVFLAFYFLKVGLGLDGQLIWLDGFLGRDGMAASEMPVQLGKRRHGDDFQVWDQGSFSGITLRDEDTFEALLAGNHAHGEYASRMAPTAIQG